MTLTTEPIGSIPRTPALLEALRTTESNDPKLNPLDGETPQQARDRILEAVKYIPVEQIGTTDDCGYAPFSDDTTTSRDSAFAEIRARILGTRLAKEAIGGR